VTRRGQAGAADGNALWARASELAQSGKLREADKVLAKLSKIAPDHADVLGLRGTLKVQAGKHAQALPLLKQAIRLDDGNATTHASLAVAYEGLAKPDEAKRHYFRALELDPNQARIHLNLGALLWQEKDRDGAVGHYRRAIELEPEFSDAHVYLGHAMHYLGRIDEALRCGETAVRLAPASAKAHLTMGLSLQSDGRGEEALHHYRRAIELNPRLAEAYAQYAYVGRVAPDDEFSGQLTRALALAGWRDGERAHLHYAAGKLANDQGRDEAAFDHWLKGAKFRRRTFDFTIAQSRKALDSYCAVFDAALFERRLREPVDGPIPIFITGMPRSGTTLAEQILASHPDVAGLGELPHVTDIAADLSLWSAATDDFPIALRDLGEEDWRRAAILYMERLAHLGDEPYISDKMPSNFNYLGLIALLFPNARIVHCRRSAMDTCFSCFTTDFTDSLHWSYDLAELGQYYGLYLELTAHWRRVLPLPMHEIQYESVVADLEGEARRLVAFCGLDWHPDCLEFHRAKRPVFTASNAQVRRPLYTSSVGRWRRYEKQLQPLIDNLPPEAVA
jgi:Tfp pilus assembly protein PilF